MDGYRAAAREQRISEIKAHAVAFLMLGLSLFALYTHTLYLAIIPLIWMAFRAGKEQGREEAHRDMERASALTQTVRFSDPEELHPLARTNPSSRLTRVPRH